MDALFPETFSATACFANHEATFNAADGPGRCKAIRGSGTFYSYLCWWTISLV